MKKSKILFLIISIFLFSLCIQANEKPTEKSSFNYCTEKFNILPDINYFSLSGGLELLTEQTYGNTRDTMTFSNSTIQSLVFTNYRYSDVWFAYYRSTTAVWSIYHVAFDMTYIKDIRINYKGAIDSLVEVQGKISGTYFPLPLQTGTSGTQTMTISGLGGGTAWVSLIAINKKD